ncbi:hypothetical protein KP509_23G046600 [Ceratopteris richardii]|uniref:glutathione transferase n=1 Tax=Ceratopteris richardii TaxID=49495 RepID=A0A8T2S000_CERRI|nr:hypothetical protein KP509_23G046600 [Ceratopteris richardii]
MAAPSDDVQVLSAFFSMFGLRVLIALEHKGVPYKYIAENIVHKSRRLRQSNPVHKKIPVLLHNGKSICESLIIVQYIDETWPSLDKPSILPKDPYSCAIARFWADFVDKKAYDAGLLIIKSLPGVDREEAVKNFIEVIQTLDTALRDVSKGKPFFGGEHIGLVDVALAPFLCWFEAYETLGEFKIWEGSNCVHLQQWATDVMEYPSVKEALKIAHSDVIVECAYNMRSFYHGD